MADEQYGYYGGDYSIRIKDIEEKQNILKDRILLIGNNLIETKEETSDKITELKKDVEKIKVELERIRSFIDIMSDEMSKFARRDDLEILSKQAKMFQPLDFVTRDEVKEMIDKRDENSDK